MHRGEQPLADLVGQSTSGPMRVTTTENIIENHIVTCFCTTFRLRDHFLLARVAGKTHDG
jgi:hypothetical protein